MRHDLFVMVLAVAALVALAAVASAENETLGANDTIVGNEIVGDDAGAFSSGLGAHVRLLQLESSIERNILIGDRVVDAIKAKNSSIDTSELEGILDELTALKAQVESTQPAAGNEGAKAFVDLKDDAISLTKEFKDKARPLLGNWDVGGLRGNVKNVTSDSLKQLQDEIKQARLQYNAERVQDILNAAGLSNPGLVDGVGSSSKGPKDVVGFLKGSFANMSQKGRGHALLGIQETRLKGGIFLRSVEDKVKLNAMERMDERLQNRLNLSDELNMSDGQRERLQSRLGNVSARIDRIDERFNRHIALVENITDRKVAKLDEKLGEAEDRGVKLEGKIDERLDSENLTDEEKAALEGRLERLGNRTDKLVGHVEDKINKTQAKGERMVDRLEGMMGNSPGWSGHGGGQ